jgi:hypothetical protein
MGESAKVFGLRVAAVMAFINGFGLEAKKLWSEADAAAKQSTQNMTDFLVRVQNLTAGEKAQADTLGNALTPKVKEHKDVLASLIETEQRQLAMTQAAGNRAAEAGVEYREMVAKIRAAGGSLQESLKAQTLAFEIFYQKLRNLSGKAPLMFSEHAPAVNQPLAELPLGQKGILGLLPFIDTGIKKTNEFSAAWRTFQQALIEAGGGFGQKVMGSFMSAIDQAESKLAQMVVKGRANFREIMPALEESLIKTGLQSAVGKVAGAFGMKGGSKPDGTASNPLHVVVVSGVPGVAGAGAVPGLPQVMHSVSGSLAGGGDVSPGKAYVVGEHHPEFFVPRVRGAVANRISAGGQIAVHNHFYGLTDVDSFRRSGAQIMGDFHRTASMVMARNS